MPKRKTPYRVGPSTFETDIPRQKRTLQRYDEGKGLIGGDPSRRPQRVYTPPPELSQTFRLLQTPQDQLDSLRDYLVGGALEVEIGSARGKFILDWAKQHPDRRFLVFEVKWKLLTRIARRAHKRKLANLWASDDDARYTLPRLLPTGSVDVFHILFPDPWWKPKHQARRLFVPPFAKTLIELLRPSGILRVATDVPGYGEQIQALFADYSQLHTNNPALAERFASAHPTDRQLFCNEIERPYDYFYFQKRST